MAYFTKNKATLTPLASTALITTITTRGTTSFTPERAMTSRLVNAAMMLSTWRVVTTKRGAAKATILFWAERVMTVSLAAMDL